MYTLWNLFQLEQSMHFHRANLHLRKLQCIAFSTNPGFLNQESIEKYHPAALRLPLELCLRQLHGDMSKRFQQFIGTTLADLTV